MNSKEAGHKNWSELSFSEKFEYITSIVFIVASLLIMSIWGWYIRKMLKYYKELQDSLNDNPWGVPSRML